MTLELKNISCERGTRQLFEKLNVSVSAGKVLHVRGENGSGKSSLLKIIALLNHSQKGEVFWQGENVAHYPEKYFENLLYLGHKGAINLQMNAVQNLTWYQNIQGQGDVSSTQQYEQAFKTLGLYGFEDIPVRHLSAGQKRKVLLARLILQNKKLWLLDEPFVSLDKPSIEILEVLMNRHLDQGGLIVFSSHQEVSIEQDKLVILNLEDFQPAGGVI